MKISTKKQTVVKAVCFFVLTNSFLSLSDTYYTAKNEKRKDFLYITEAPIMKAQNLHEEK